MKLLKLLVGKLKKKMNEEEKCGSVPVKHCPMVAKVLDLCCGAYGECSDGVKRLLDVMAETRLQSLGLRKGSLEAAKELSLVTGYLRRRLSTAIVKANVKCLLERLVKVGEGRGQVDRRRRWARQEEARARLEREAQWQERISGRNLVRRGDFPTL